MIDKVAKEECCGCEACASICPTKAIQMKEFADGFLYPQILNEACVHCETCETVCPAMQVPIKKKGKEETRAYACYNKNYEVRQESTSGGIFTLLAEYVIEQKHGVVFGARFDKSYSVEHAKAETMEEIKAFRGSKYVQSQIGDCYKLVEISLKAKKIVLFTGLPCQIEGLKNYLGGEKEHLYCMDMVCFGIGSPGIWNRYLTEFHDKTKISQVVFKDKIKGWKDWKVKVVEDNHAIYFGNRENLYMNSYLKRINVRNSCFSCKYRGIERNSDITLADCWGVGEKNQTLNDDKGLTAMLVHSEKGKELFDGVKENMVYQQYEPSVLMEGNRATCSSPEKSAHRESFMEDIKQESFIDVMRRYCMW